MSRSRGSGRSQMAATLLDWYDAHARQLPWRAPPGTSADPYHVWLSEIMLQQTTVVVVKPYFAKFLNAWPNVCALATAELEDVLKAWAGLGYYARARNLHKCARVVADDHGCRFPTTRAGLLELPGIGPYTAGAIAAIAFGEREVAVDGNVERVIARAFALETPLPDAKPEVSDIAGALVPAARPGDFAQAMMDLGATVCTPRKPNCLICPWMETCLGRAGGLQDVLPYKRAKTPRPTRHGVAFWVERRDGTVLVRRRPERGLLGGMSEIPSTEWSEAGVPGDPAAQAPVRAHWTRLPGLVRHTFTHFHLELEVWAALETADVQLAGTHCDAGRWVARADLYGEALPSVMKKVVALAAES